MSSAVERVSSSGPIQGHFRCTSWSQLEFDRWLLRHLLAATDGFENEEETPSAR
jgi:hypothetical protein